MTRNARRPRPKRREMMTERMIAVVEELLRDGESYIELSVDRIVDQAGISRTTFYVYFEDKGQLLLALTDTMAGRFVRAAEQWWALSQGATRDALRDALRVLVEEYRPHHFLWGALIDSAAYDPQVRERYIEVVGLGAGELAEHIRAGQAEGWVRSDLDPDRVSRCLIWMIERELYQFTAQTTDDDVEAATDALSSIVWYALYAVGD